MHDQKILNEYFSTHWDFGSGRQITSYENIAKKIKPNEWVLDVGCGHNPFKELLPNVVGIDPAFDNADYKCTIEEFQPQRLFDVALCLGSINFGTEDIIKNQIQKVVNCLKNNSRIYWRLNPGRQDHENEECKKIMFFPWTFEYLEKLSKIHNYQQLKAEIDHHVTRPRLYAEWHR